MSIDLTNHRLLAYDPSQSRVWDNIVKRARNGHFMFQRSYMDYHADRFEDASFLLLRGEAVVAVLPAHRREDALVSHGGVSFGGWIQTPRCLHHDIAAGFALLGAEMRSRRLKRLLYTPLPYPYHTEPCGDDLYLLEKLGARCVQMRLSAFLPLIPPAERNSEFRRRLRRGEELAPGTMMETTDTEKFWGYLGKFLAERHDAQPVHTATEMRLLQERFPDNIRLFVLSHGDEWRAGEVIFLSNNVLRFQYGFYFFTDRREALSLRTLEWLRTNEALHLPWMDLGTSMDPDTGELVGTLHLHKEIFGARGVPLKTWEWVP